MKMHKIIAHIIVYYRQRYNKPFEQSKIPPDNYR